MESLKNIVSASEYDFMKMHLEKQLSQSGYVFMNHLQEVYKENNKIYNILAYSFNNKKLNAGREKFEKEKDLTLVSSSPFNFELEHPNASKGKSLAYLAKLLNKDLGISMAIGDSGNDVSMFETVTESFAMANANDAVKTKAKHITASNDENGVAKAIYRFLGIGEA